MSTSIDLSHVADDELQSLSAIVKSINDAALLGRDAAAVATDLTTARILSVLEQEASGEELLLAADMGGNVATNLSLLEAVLFGFKNAALSTLRL